MVSPLPIIVCVRFSFLGELFRLGISEGALDAAFRRTLPCLDAASGVVLVRQRRAHVVGLKEIGVRINGQPRLELGVSGP